MVSVKRGNHAHLQKRLGQPMDKRTWIILITIIIMVITGLITHGYDEPVESPVEPPVVEMIEPLEAKLDTMEKKEVVWTDNPFNCTSTQWIAKEDFTCIDKPAPKPVPVNVAPAPTGSCMDWIIEAGTPAGDRDALYALIMRESGCNPGVFNPTSSAGGIPQALPFSKMGCSTSEPICQIKWMINYCNVRYGGIQQANIFQINNNWY